MAPYFNAQDFRLRDQSLYTKVGQTITLDDIIRARAREQDQKPLLAFPANDQAVTDFETFNGRDLDHFAEQAARYYASRGIKAVTQETVVAQLAPTNLAYIITFLALSRLGYTILCLSPRLAPTAGAELCKNCGAKAIIIGETSWMNELATAMQQLVRIDILTCVKREIFGQADLREPSFSREGVDSRTESQRTCMILHSSGTTGLPKPVYIPQNRLMIDYPPAAGQVEFSTFPFHHAYGNQIVLRNIKDRKTTFMYNQDVPLTADYIIGVLDAVHPDALHVVPYILELLALTPKGETTLRKCRRIVFAGGGFPDDLGNKLVERGVNLETMWGMTEAGTLGSSCGRSPSDKAWDYIRISESYKDHVWMAPVEENLHECVFLNTLPSLTAKNSESPPGSFRSNDLFKQHPVIPNAWKHVGRLDDRLTLANGEKVLPVPMEDRIRRHPLVKEAVIFGAGRSVPGLLVFRDDSAVGLRDEDFLDRIWPAVEDANANAESFSQLITETVIPFSETVSYAMTDKRSVKRRQIYEDFAQDIGAMYERLDISATGTLQLDTTSMEAWLQKTFKDSLHIPIENRNSDFYSAGVSSLQAIQMRSLILRHIDLGGRSSELDHNVIYNSGNVARLAQCLQAISAGNGYRDSGGEDEIDLMASLIAKYSVFAKHHPGSSVPERDCAIVTGATGSLGAQVVARLVQIPTIEHIYCLVRGSEPERRLHNALIQRHIAIPDRPRITALSCDLSLPTLGLSSKDYSQICAKTTIIFHCAWTVNFNLGLRSFESQHIAGVHNLIQCSLSTPYAEPARFYFCSSIAAGLATPSSAVVEERRIENLSYAMTQGYGRSKLVAENIVLNAARDFGALSRVFRIGQVVGDKAHGIWSDTEAVPLILRSALKVEALPSLDETQSWMPVDTLAAIMCDLADLSTVVKHHDQTTVCQWDKNLVYNLENPNTFHWTEKLLPELARLEFQFSIVSPSAWLDKLREYKGDAEDNPAVKLLGYYESRYGTHAGSGYSRPTFCHKSTIRNSEHMRLAPDVIEDGYLARFLEVWLKKWTGDGIE